MDMVLHFQQNHSYFCGRKNDGKRIQILLDETENFTSDAAQLHFPGSSQNKMAFPFPGSCHCRPPIKAHITQVTRSRAYFT